MMEIILGIETSCDETAASVYSHKNGVLSNVLHSQIEKHKEYGGVIPEIASRSHLEKINEIVEQALTQANVTLDEIDAIAVTNKPGLPGSLLIGVGFAKSLAFAKNKKLISVNHLEGHAYSACIENNVSFPALCLTASGGHTSLYLLHDYGNYEVLGQTLDDAAGEAFDKIAKMMGYPYPGGPIIEQLAAKVLFHDFFKFPRNKITTLDFSFSGLKTAVLYDLVNKSAYDMATKKFLKPHDDHLKEQVASSLLVAVKDIFTRQIERAFEKHPHVKSLTFVGGVACNKYLKEQLKNIAYKHGKEFYSPTSQYCTDNAAMIAFVGDYKAQKGEFVGLDLDIFE